MEQFDYYRLHVESSTGRDLSNWTNEKVFAAFLLLKPPHLDLEMWSGIMNQVSKPNVPTQAEQDAANAAFVAANPSKVTAS